METNNEMTEEVWFAQAERLGRVEGVNVNHPEVKAAMRAQFAAGVNPDDALNAVLASL